MRLPSPLGGRCPWPRPRTDEGKVCPTSPYTGNTRKEGEAKNSREAAASREFFYHKLYVRIGTL